ncbi:MAG: ubiquitin-like domain-containing protein [Acutalibacteraceae bacterium]
MDNDSETAVSVNGKNVSEALSEADVSVGEKDEVEPALDSEIEEGAQISVKRYAKVKVNVDSKEYEVEMVGATVGDAIKKLGIELDEKDVIDCDQEAYLTDGMEINIKKGKKIYITVGGKKKSYVVKADNVKDALDECKIEYDSDDIIEPGLKKSIKQKSEIVVKKVEVKKEKTTQIIYFKTEKQYSASMNKGTSKVKVAGVNGKKEITYEKTYIDGELSKSEQISEKVISNPTNEVVVYGTKEITTTKAATTAVPTTKAPTTKAPTTKAPTTKAPTTKAATTSAPKATSKTVVSKEAVYDCDGSEHGYYIITYSDGSVEYQDF